MSCRRFSILWIFLVLSRFCAFASSFQICENIASLKKSNYEAGIYVRTLGYYEVGDGGGNEFVIVNSNSVENGGTVIQLENGCFAKSILDRNLIDIRHFGARNNANDHSDSYFRNYVEWCKLYRDYVVKLPAMVLSLYDTYVFEPNAAGKNIKLIGEHLIEHRYLAEIIEDDNLNTYSGTIIYSHSPNGILFDIQNRDLYAGVVLEGIALFGNKHKSLALRIVSGGQELKISDVAILDFEGGAIHFNNVYDGYITNLTIKGCGRYYDNKTHPALRLYTDKKEAIRGLSHPTNTNALHFTNFHFEHCDCFASFEKCADIFFVNGKIESMAGEGETYSMDKVKSSDPFISFTKGGGLVSFNSVFFKTPSTVKMMLSNPDLDIENLPYFINIDTDSRGLITFDNCMFLSYGGGGLPFNCHSSKSHCTVTNSVFRYVATGRTAIKANQMTIIGCTFCMENDGSLYVDGQPCRKAISSLSQGKPIEIGNDCILLGNKFVYGGSQFIGQAHTQYELYPITLTGDNNIIKDNMFEFVDDNGASSLLFP